MGYLIRRQLAWVVCALLASFAGTASADVRTTGIAHPPYTGTRYDIAFDSTNQVYLLTTDASVRGQWIDKNGNLIGGLFTIASEPAGTYTSWSTVTFGGPDSNPTFLVTYLAVEGSAAPKYGRYVRYINGAAAISDRFKITDVNGEWFAADRARTVWDGNEFVVSTRVKPAGATDPMPQVQKVDLAGNVSAATLLGDYLDYEGSPSLACSPTVCLAVAFAAGRPFGSKGGIYARRFDVATLAPLGSGFYLDDHSTFMDTPKVAYNSKTARFITSWYRRDPGSYLDFRLVGTDGSLGPLDTSKSFGPGAGDNALSYNAVTQTTLVVTKAGSDATLYAFELGDDGYRLNPSNFAQITTWDGGWPTYSTEVTASTKDARWVVTYMEGTRVGPGAVIVDGTARHKVASGDITGDGQADRVTFTPASGSWSAPGLSSTVSWGRAGDIPLQADFDGDGMMDIVIYRPSTQEWWFKKSNTMVQYGRPGDLPVPADYDGDGKAEIAIFRPSTGEWYIRGNSATPVKWGMPADIPVPGDYNGDGKAEFAVFRRATGKWWIYGVGEIAYGARGDVPVPADYDGDGRTDIAVYRPSTGIWFVKDQFWRRFGAAGFVPVPMDVNGDGKADLVMFRSSTASWFVMDVGTNAITETVFGNPGDIPVGAALRTTSVFGDVDGDRRADPAIFRPATSEWFLQQSTGGSAVHFAFASAFDVPVAGDYDGDGKMDAAIWQPSTGMWYIRTSSSGFSTLITVGPWGLPTDVPMPADYDGDGKADVAVYRPSTGEWFFKQSSSDFTTTDYLTWGMPGDTPIAADFDGDGYADPAVFRPSEGMWYVNLRLAGSRSAYQWGMTGDTPLVGDFDGDGIGDRVVYRAGQGLWFLQLSTGTTRTVQWGLATDIPLVADFDGDGRSDIVVYRPSTGRWYILNLISNTATAVDWGVLGDIPLLKR